MKGVQKREKENKIKIVKRKERRKRMGGIRKEKREN